MRHRGRLPGRVRRDRATRRARSGSNRDHSWDKPIGKIVAFHPSRSEGLVAEVRIVADTDSARRRSRSCDDGVPRRQRRLPAVAARRRPIWDDAEVWEQNRTVRRLNRLCARTIRVRPEPRLHRRDRVDVRDNEPRRPRQRRPRTATGSTRRTESAEGRRWTALSALRVYSLAQEPQAPQPLETKPQGGAAVAGVRRSSRDPDPRVRATRKEPTAMGATDRCSPATCRRSRSAKRSSTGSSPPPTAKTSPTSRSSSSTTPGNGWTRSTSKIEPLMEMRRISGDSRGADRGARPGTCRTSRPQPKPVEYRSAGALRARLLAGRARQRGGAAAGCRSTSGSPPT